MAAQALTHRTFRDPLTGETVTLQVNVEDQRELTDNRSQWKRWEAVPIRSESW